MDLTKTEFKVCAYTASGYEVKEIARMVFRSYHTIASHIKSVRIKNGLKNVAEVTREFVLEHGDPRQYIKTFLLFLQLAITFSAMDSEIKRPKRSGKTRIQRVIRKK